MLKLRIRIFPVKALVPVLLQALFMGKLKIARRRQLYILALKQVNILILVVPVVLSEICMI